MKCAFHNRRRSPIMLACIHAGHRRQSAWRVWWTPSQKWFIPFAQRIHKNDYWPNGPPLQFTRERVDKRLPLDWPGPLASTLVFILPRSITTNVILSGDGNVNQLDFGLSFPLVNGQPNAALSNWPGVNKKRNTKSRNFGPNHGKKTWKRRYDYTLWWVLT